MKMVLLAVLGPLVARVSMGEDSINIFNTASTSQELGLSLCSMRSAYQALRAVSPRGLRFVLLVDPELDAERACVAASAVLSRAVPYGNDENNATDDWMRCAIVSATDLRDASGLSLIHI